VLHNKAVASLVTAMTAFNSPVDTGRTTHVLLHLQHAFEMLLKAALSARVLDVNQHSVERAVPGQAPDERHKRAVLRRTRIATRTREQRVD